MSTRFLFVLAFVCGIGAAAGAAEMTGIVVSADTQSITLRHDDGTEMTHQLAPGLTIRDEDGTAIAVSQLANRRVEIELDDAARVTSVELADADAAGDVGRMGADPTTGGTEDRAAEAGDPAAPDPAGGEMARAELPDTAGPITLVALIGGALLAAAYATRAYRRR